MDEKHHGDARIVIQRLFHVRYFRLFTVAISQDLVRPVEPLHDLNRPFAISAVADHQHLAPADGGEVSKRRLYRERSRPLHQHAGIGVVAPRELHEAPADVGNDEF